MFTEELVKSLMDSSREEAIKNLHQDLAISELSKAENIEIEEKEIDEKFKEVSLKLAGEKNIDYVKLREVIKDDLLKTKILAWLEENNTVIEKPPSKMPKPETKGSKTKSEKSTHSDFGIPRT